MSPATEDAGVVDVLIKAGRPVREVSEWGKVFLKGVRKSGNISRSARKARVSPTTVRKYAKAHPEFLLRISAALREYGDALEQNLGDLAFKGNAIANIARLKALNKRLAAKYSEKAVDARVMNVIVNGATSVEPQAASDLMARLTGRLAPQEVRAMRGEVIDVTPLALPMASGAERPPNHGDEEPR